MSRGMDWDKARGRDLARAKHPLVADRTLIPLRYGSTCKLCGRAIKPKQKAWYGDGGTFICRGCVSA